MRNFRYRAIDSHGAVQQAEIEAQCQRAVVDELRSRRLTVLDIQETAAKKKSVKQAAPKPTVSIGGISRKTVMIFTRQLSTTLAAGLPLMRILGVLHKRTREAGLRKVLEQTGNDLQHGSSFSDALARHPHVFDSMYLNMVRVGEAGGTLCDTMARLARMLEKETALARKIRGALFYPTFVLIFTVAIAYLMLAFLMPMFTPMFESSGLDIKSQFPLTWFLMNASAVCANHRTMGIVIAGAVVLWLAMRAILRTRSGRYALDFLLFHAPLMSQMVRQTASARFCRAFSTLLKSGVPVLQSLQLVADSSGNMVVARSIGRVARNIQSGDRISETLHAVGVFPDLVVQMAAVGEEAGTLPDMLERVADHFEDELDTTLNGLTALIEPAMMLIVGAMVGVFVMGLLLPILGISTAYQNQMAR